MEYIEVGISGLSMEYTEILIAELSESGFESFYEEDGGRLNAYIPSDSFEIMPVANFLEERSSSMGFSYQVSRIPWQNWNAAWESGYQPVMISGRCLIRAPFHKPDPHAEFDLIIEPKMSFGTAHHETTQLMIESVLAADLQCMKVLDMGCGTAVLAVLASKMGATQVVAVDIDQYACENALENAARNNAEGIRVIHGDATTVPEGGYNIILANINRNVLLKDMRNYYNLLLGGGLMMLSGFYSDDAGIILENAGLLGFRHTGSRELNNWVVATFTK